MPDDTEYVIKLVAEVDRLQNEITAWKQVYDSKKAENEQLRRDGNVIIDKIRAEVERLRSEVKVYKFRIQQLEADLIGALNRELQNEK